MSHSFGELRAEDLDLLAMLAVAALDDPDSVPFAYLPLAGRPFAWLIHPRLAGGEARVVDLESLARLEEAGCVVFTIDDGEPPSRYAMLTHAGLARYRRRHGQPGGNQAHDIQSDVATHIGSSLV